MVLYFFQEEKVLFNCVDILLTNKLINKNSLNVALGFVLSYGGHEQEQDSANSQRCRGEQVVKLQIKMLESPTINDSSIDLRIVGSNGSAVRLPKCC